MYTYFDLKEYLKDQDIRLIMVADAETRVHERKGDKLTIKIPAGGVSVALDPIIKAAGGIYIGRGKTEADKEVVDRSNKYKVVAPDGEYTLKRVFSPKEEEDAYYYGFSNQTLWPLCHVAFEAPEFHDEWYQGYKAVNERFAKAIREELTGNKKTVLWIHDYQMTLVPSMVKNVNKNTVIGMFWHIPWPTWEVFRILPQKKEILESMLACDFIAFHRGYQASNFLETVERELEVRIDRERNKIHYKDHATTVTHLPLGIDNDVIRSLLVDREEKGIVGKFVQSIIGTPKVEEDPFEEFFKSHKVIVGVDRLDYTKGLLLRLRAIDRFLEQNPSYIGKVVYVGIVAPSREPIPSYAELKKDLKAKAQELNKKYVLDNGWMPIFLLHDVFNRHNVMQFYQRANLCLVTPRDDGMNLVSKEFVLASSKSSDPGMLVLSQFAGSAMDLTEALIVNPYDTNEVARAIKTGLEMDKKEKVERIAHMVTTLDERNLYQWAEQFLKSTLASATVPRK